MIKSNPKVTDLLKALGDTEFEVALRLLKGGFVRNNNEGICEGCPTAQYLRANGIEDASVNYSCVHDHFKGKWQNPLPEPVAKFVAAFTCPRDHFPNWRG